MDTPKISIITVVRNDLSGFRKTAGSVLGQTDFGNTEWIVIDGASTDGTAAAVAELSPSMAYWISEPDDGVYFAMNKAIAKARGEYLIFMNAGDTFYSPDSVARILSDEGFGEFDILAGDALTVPAPESVKRAPERVTLPYLIESNLCHQSMTIRRRLFEGHLYDTDYRLTADAKHLFEAVMKRGAIYRRLGFTVAVYDRGGLSSDHRKMTAEKEAWLSEQLSPTVYDEIRRLMYGEGYLDQVICNVRRQRGLRRILGGFAWLLFAPQLIVRKWLNH